MSWFTKTELERRLEDVTIAAKSINTVSVWLIKHRIHFQAIVRIWFKKLVEASKERKLIFMYLADDLLQKSKKEHQEYITEFGDHMEKVVEHLVTVNLDGRNSGMIERLVKTWREWKLFDEKRQFDIEKIWNEGTGDGGNPLKRREIVTSVHPDAPPPKKVGYKKAKMDDAKVPNSNQFSNEMVKVEIKSENERKPCLVTKPNAEEGKLNKEYVEAEIPKCEVKHLIKSENERKPCLVTQTGDDEGLEFPEVPDITIVTHCGGEIEVFSHLEGVEVKSSPQVIKNISDVKLVVPLQMDREENTQFAGGSSEPLVPGKEGGCDFDKEESIHNETTYNMYHNQGAVWDGYQWVDHRMNQHDWFSVPPPGHGVYGEMVSIPGNSGITSSHDERKERSWEESVQMFLKEKGGYDQREQNRTNYDRIKESKISKSHKNQGVEKRHKKQSDWQDLKQRIGRKKKVDGSKCERNDRSLKTERNGERGKEKVHGKKCEVKVTDRNSKKERNKERIKDNLNERKFEGKVKDRSLEKERVSNHSTVVQSREGRTLITEVSLNDLDEISSDEMDCASNLAVDDVAALQNRSDKSKRRIIEKSNKVISDELKKLHESRTELGKMVTILEKEKKALEEKVVGQGKELEDIKGKHMTSQKETERLEKEIREIIFTKLGKMVTTLEKEKRAFEEKVTTLEKEKKALEDKVREHVNELEGIKGNYMASQKEIEILAKEIEDKKLENNILSVASMLQIDRLKLEKADLEEKVVGQGKELEDIEGKFMASQKEKEALEEKLVVQGKELEDIKENYMAGQKKTELLEREIQDKNLKNNTLSVASVADKNGIAKLKKEKEALEETVVGQGKELEDIKGKFLASQEEVKIFEKEILDKNLKNNILNGTSVTDKNTIAKFILEKAVFEEKIELLEKDKNLENYRLRVTSATAKNTMDNLSKSINDHKQRNEELEKTVKDLKQRIEEVEKEKKEANSALWQNMAKHRQEFTDTIVRFKNAMAKLKKEKEDLEEKVGVQGSISLLFRKKGKELEDWKGKYMAGQEETSLLKKEIKDKNLENYRLCVSSATAKNTMDNLIKTVNDQKQRIEELEKEKNEENSALKIAVATKNHQEISNTIGKSGPVEASNTIEELFEAKKALSTKEQELEQLKKDSEDKNEQLKKLKNNNVKLVKIGRNFREKLTLSEDQNNKIMEDKKKLEELNKNENNAAKEDLSTKEKKLEQLKKDSEDKNEDINKLNNTIAQLSEDNTKLDVALKAFKEEMHLKSSSQDEIIANSPSERRGDVDLKALEAADLIAQSAAEIVLMSTELDEIKAENEALKIQKVELENKELQKKLACSKVSTIDDINSNILVHNPQTVKPSTLKRKASSSSSDDEDKHWKRRSGWGQGEYQNNQQINAPVKIIGKEIKITTAASGEEIQKGMQLSSPTSEVALIPPMRNSFRLKPAVLTLDSTRSGKILAMANSNNNVNLKKRTIGQDEKNNIENKETQAKPKKQIVINKEKANGTQTQSFVPSYLKPQVNHQDTKSSSVVPGYLVVGYFGGKTQAINSKEIVAAQLGKNDLRRKLQEKNNKNEATIADNSNEDKMNENNNNHSNVEENNDDEKLRQK